MPTKKSIPMKKNTRFTKLILPDPEIRVPIAVSAGCHLIGTALPQNDTKDPLSLLVGGANRVTSSLPEPDPNYFYEYTKFAREETRRRFKPLPADTVIDRAAWLEARPYTAQKKKTMWKAWLDANCELTENELRFSIFSKDEPTEKWGFNRLICAPQDAAKVYFGPYVSLIEEQAYKYPEFIKKIPVRERPQYLLDLASQMPDTADKIDGDFNSYECTFKRSFKEAVELDFFDYMTQYLPDAGQIQADFRSWIAAENTELKNKFFSIHMQECSRWSGEPGTSLFNGLNTLYVNLFYAQRTAQKVALVVEGDDSLTIWSKQAPTEEHYTKLGFSVKITQHKILETSSFCGQVFASKDLAVLTDPRYVMAGLAWIPQRYLYSKSSSKLALLRAKGWSFGYQYQGCPIISSMARYVLRLTRSVDARKAFTHLDQYQADELREAMDRFDPRSVPGMPGYVPIGMESRLLVERLYGISLTVQEAYEHYFDTCEVLQPIPNWFGDLPEAWKQAWEWFVREVKMIPELVNMPPELWPIRQKSEIRRRVIAREPRWQKYIDARIEIIPND